MQIGEVIRKYRKEKQLTQEEMAGYLGVTAPAVNKWENGNSFPDISLLAPIARLLGITTDTLLSYKEELTDLEIRQIIEGIGDKVKDEGYDAAFAWAEENVREYPNCIRLAFLAAQALEGYRIIYGIEHTESCDRRLYEWYTRSLESQDYELLQAAAMALYQLFLQRKEYQRAQEYLDRIPRQRRGVSPAQMQANLYVQQGRNGEAYPLYEELLFDAYIQALGALNGILGLALKEGDMDKAVRISARQKGLAKLFEMGSYQEASPELALAIQRQDKEKALKLLEEIVQSIPDIEGWRSSELYSHMAFSETGAANVFLMLKRGLENGEDAAFLRDDGRFAELMEKLDRLIGVPRKAVPD